MVPAACADAGGITKSTLHFVGQCNRRDQLRATCTDAFRRRQRSGNIVARMRGLFRQIGIVVVEIANAACIRECCPVWRCLVVRPDNCRSSFCRKFRGDLSRDRTRLLIPRTERATERVEHAALDFVSIWQADEQAFLTWKELNLQSADESPVGNSGGVHAPPIRLPARNAQRTLLP